jgi:hypothetical protein
LLRDVHSPRRTGSMCFKPTYMVPSQSGQRLNA